MTEPEKKKLQHRCSHNIDAGTPWNKLYRYPNNQQSVAKHCPSLVQFPPAFLKRHLPLYWNLLLNSIASNVCNKTAIYTVYKIPSLISIHDFLFCIPQLQSPPSERLLVSSIHFVIQYASYVRTISKPFDSLYHSYVLSRQLCGSVPHTSLNPSSSSY